MRNRERRFRPALEPLGDLVMPSPIPGTASYEPPEDFYQDDYGDLELDEEICIHEFECVLEQGRIFTFHGRVTGIFEEGHVVWFGGIPSLQGRSAPVALVGGEWWFCLTVELQPNEEGTATARVFNQDGTPVSDEVLTLVRQI